MDEKLARLQEILREMGSVAVAYSGGVDSTFLLKVAHDVLGARVVALTADSPTVPRRELREAQALARIIGAPHVCLDAAENPDPRYAANPPDRCYFCRSHYLDLLVAYAAEHGYSTVADGANTDDLGDFRPGRRAGQERGVRSPLLEAGLAKAEIRSLSHAAGLPGWDRPSAACLASRLPYGTEVTDERLSQIERAEDYLHDAGFRQVRVRHHGAVARLELDPGEFARALELRQGILAALREIGFAYASLDLGGFRSGSMNETLGQSGALVV